MMTGRKHGHLEPVTGSVYVGHKSGCLQTWPVKILTMFGFSLSYDSALLGGSDHVTDIGKNLIPSLVSKRYGNRNLAIICVQRHSIALKPMQDKHLFLDLKWPMMYAYPLFAFVYL
jgi:hypothetical protein